MSPTLIFFDWLRTVQCLFPTLHAYQHRTLATLSFGMAQALHCHLSRAAVHCVGTARPKSTERRFQRYLANPRIEVAPCSQTLAQTVLSAWRGCRIVVVLDEVPLGNRLRCLRVSLAYRRRALPLLWRCYPPDAPPKPLPGLIVDLFDQLASCLPSSSEVILLADRGLSWPSTLDAIRSHGWHYVLRLQKDVRVRLSDGSTGTVQSLLQGGACPLWKGSGVIFKKAGGRETNLVCAWQSPPHDPWLVATDLPPTLQACSLYRKRTWFEESNRDEKSYGFDWQKSRVWDPDHAERLLLALALATLWVLSLGTQVIKRGWRTLFESRARRLYSVFQLGWRWMEWALRHEHPLPTRLVFYPPSKRSLPP